jgi:hypothetical protein
MTERKKTLSKTKKLRLKKETLKDLGTKNAGRVKGGVGLNPSRLCNPTDIMAACQNKTI